MLKDIYSHLKAHLATITGIEQVDYYLGQYDQNDKDSVLYSTPALFIEFAPIQWLLHAKNIQRAILTFTIHTVTDSVYDDDERILNSVNDHFAYVTEVYKKLAGHRHKVGDQVLMETIERLSTTPDHVLDVIIVTKQEFRCVIFDYSALPQTTTTQIQSINITPQIET
jgi:phage gp37-like protein